MPRALWLGVGLVKVCCWVKLVSFTLRLYSCLANGSADEFQRGDQLFRMRAVKDPLQIGKAAACPVRKRLKQLVCMSARLG